MPNCTIIVDEVIERKIMKIITYFRFEIKFLEAAEIYSKHNENRTMNLKISRMKNPLITSSKFTLRR
jgi:hypothetical protein